MVGTPPDGFETAHLPHAAPPTNHGHTPAAWVTVALVIAGAVVASGGVLAARAWLFWVGLGVVVVAMVAGRTLKAFGYGQPEPSGPARRAERSGS